MVHHLLLIHLCLKSSKNRRGLNEDFEPQQPIRVVKQHTRLPVTSNASDFLWHNPLRHFHTDGGRGPLGSFKTKVWLVVLVDKNVNSLSSSKQSFVKDSSHAETLAWYEGKYCLFMGTLVKRNRFAKAHMDILCKHSCVDIWQSWDGKNDMFCVGAYEWPTGHWKLILGVPLSSNTWLHLLFPLPPSLPECVKRCV